MSFLNKKIFSLSPRPFGLDVSDLSLKMVYLDREGDRDRVMSFGTVVLPPGVVLDGEIQNGDTVAAAIRDLLDRSGPRKVRTRQVICSLPEIKAFLRIINLPKMDESEVSEAIKWEIEANIPLSLDQVYYDWQILGRNLIREKEKMSILVVAMARSIVDQSVHALEKAGLEVVGLETESLAQARSLLSHQESDLTTLIVDIGDRRTSFLVAIGNTPCFTSSIALSSQMVTDAISKAMHIPFQEAENIKLTYGIGSAVRKDPLFRAVEPIMQSLALEIGRSIDFYVNGLKYSPSVDRIVLCGGGSQMRGLLPYLSHALHVPIEQGNPWVNVRLGSGLPAIERAQSNRYSTAIGLALRSLNTYGY